MTIPFNQVADHLGGSQDAFKPVFKYWKRRCPKPPDLDSAQLVDTLADPGGSTKLIEVALSSSNGWMYPPESASWDELHLKKPTHWKMHKFNLTADGGIGYVHLPNLIKVKTCHFHHI